MCYFVSMAAPSVLRWTFCGISCVVDNKLPFEKNWANEVSRLREHYNISLRDSEIKQIKKENKNKEPYIQVIQKTGIYI